MLNIQIVSHQVITPILTGSQQWKFGLHFLKIKSRAIILSKIYKEVTTSVQKYVQTDGRTGRRTKGIT